MTPRSVACATVLLLAVPDLRAGDSPAATEALAGLPPPVRAAHDAIRGDRILAAVRFLSSARLEGREAGKRGAEVAADYLVSRMQAAGLSPGTKEGFLQRFDVRYRLLHADEEMTLERDSGRSKARRSFEPGRHFMPFDFSELGLVEAPVVFAGFGIHAPDRGWDDYASLGADGARGKVVVVLRHEPDEDGAAGGAFFDGREMTMHASFRAKARAAAAHGAVGLVVVDDPLYHEVPADPRSGLSRFTIPTEKERALPPGDPKRPRGLADVEVEATPLGVMAVHASQEILRWLAPDRDWKALQREMESARKPRSFALPGVTAKLVHRVEEQRDGTANVLGILPGSDPARAGEYVLVGGHYDHVGKDEGSGDVYHGADDNASGTAVVLAVADAFASLPERPARSLVFVGWSAEEKGLLGSMHFAYRPSIPIEGIVAAFNLDMVGRNKETEMSVVGRGEAPDLAAILDRFAPAVGLQLNDDAGAGAARSDNASLWLGGVPTVSVFSGTHEDYHEPTDTADKIVPGKLERTARLVFLAAREVAAGSVTPARLAVPEGAWRPVAPRRRGRAQDEDPGESR